MESFVPSSDDMPAEFAEADEDAELQDLGDGLETSTRDLRKLWAEWLCHRGSGGFADPRFFGKTIGGVPIPAVDAYLALEAALRSSGYEPASAWSYNCRAIAGSSSYSLHSYGVAIDLDPSVNPFSVGDPFSGKIKEKHVTAVLGIKNGDGVSIWSWGGNWKKRDRMHFQLDRGPAGVDVDWSTVPGAAPEGSASDRSDQVPKRVGGVVRTPTVSPEEETMLKQGSKGAAVKQFQQALQAWEPAALPKHGADGDYGTETVDWVGKYQEALGLPVTGNIDGITAALLVLETSASGPGA